LKMDNTIYLFMVDFLILFAVILFFSFNLDLTVSLFVPTRITINDADENRIKRPTLLITTTFRSIVQLVKTSTKNLVKHRSPKEWRCPPWNLQMRFVCKYAIQGTAKHEYNHFSSEYSKIAARNSTCKSYGTVSGFCQPVGVFY
jgi:hypothetical protein